MIELVMVYRQFQHPSLLPALQEKYVVHRLWEVANKEQFIASISPNVRGMVTDHLGVSADLMGQFPNLEIITNFGVGYDSVDVKSATKNGIWVTNTPGVLTDDVADLAILLLLATARGLCEGDRFIRNGQWHDGPMRFTENIKGKRIGILGLGRIGQAIAHRAGAFGLSVSYHGPREKPEQPYPFVPNLVELAEASDFLVASCPGGSETRHLINQEVMLALGSEGILINVARGSVVDEPALVEALKQGRLGGAGLDVFENEPNVPEALLSMENVVLQPHQGSATNQTRIAMGQIIIDNLDAHFSGKPLLTPVNSVTK